MKNLITIVFISLALVLSAQRKIIPTDQFSITGKVKSELKFTLADIENFEAKTIPDVVITNKKGEIKDTVKDLKGILLKNILDKIEFPIEKPKELNEFYFTFVASDGYKVVFSWNEIFNSETGNNLFVVTEMKGKKISELEERILVITTSDFKTGHRYIKGLEKVIVGRVE